MAYDGGSDVDVRQALSVGQAKLSAGLRAGIEQLVTIVTGKPLPGQTRLVKVKPDVAWLLSLVALVLSVAANAWLLMSAMNWHPAAWPLAGVGYYFLSVITTGRLRSQQVTYAHLGVHVKASNAVWLNWLITHLALAIPLSSNPVKYREEHVGRHHRNRYFTTSEDDDAKFLIELGFRAGMKREEAWALLRRSLVSPAFYWKFAVGRLSGALWKSSWTHRAFVLASLAAWTATSFLMPMWVFAAVVLVPLVIMYEASALLQFLTEHRWLVTPDGPKTVEEYASRSAGRFCGEPPPCTGFTGEKAPVSAWAGWSMRMAFIHVPVRLGILVGDLPAHDQHHMEGHNRQLAEGSNDPIFDRQRVIDAGDLWSMRHRENWGLRAMIDWVFEGLEGASK